MIASATWSTWIGGISNALAIDSNAEVALKAPESSSEFDVDLELAGSVASIPGLSDAAVLFALVGCVCSPSLAP
jgi:hypothetical protein